MADVPSLEDPRYADYGAVPKPTPKSESTIVTDLTPSVPPTQAMQSYNVNGEPVFIPVQELDASQITNNFGYEREGGARTHKGIDLGFGMAAGTPILAAMSGWLVYRERRSADGGGSGYGVAVKIEDKFGNFHQYAHLDERTLTDFGVTSGGYAQGEQRVRINAGDVIGYMGDTGNAKGTEPHLHYAINEGVSGKMLINPYQLVTSGVYAESSLLPGDTEEGWVSSEYDNRDWREFSLDEITPEVREEIERDHPGWSVMLDDEEIGKLLIAAIQQNWTNEKFQMQLESTNWWRQQTQTKRDWEVLKMEQPAEAEQQRAGTEAEIRRMAAFQGVALTDVVVKDLAEQALSKGWIDTRSFQQIGLQLQTAIVSLGKVNDSSIGKVDVSAGDVMNAAMAQHVAIDEKSAFDMAQRIARGELSMDTVKYEFQQEAMRNNPYWAESIRKGMTMADLFAPRQNRIARLLGIDPTEVDYMKDQRWANVMFNGDQGRPMTYAEMDDYVRLQPEWDKTDDAMGLAAKYGEFFLQKFGAVR